MLYNKVGVFFKSLQMTVIISSTMSVMIHSQEHDTHLVAAGERERALSSDFPASVDLLHLFQTALHLTNVERQPLFIASLDVAFMVVAL